MAPPSSGGVGTTKGLGSLMNPPGEPLTKPSFTPSLCGVYTAVRATPDSCPVNKGSSRDPGWSDTPFRVQVVRLICLSSPNLIKL